MKGPDASSQAGAPQRKEVLDKEGPPTTMMANLSACPPTLQHCKPKHLSSHTTAPSTPILGHMLQRIPSWARPGVTIISSPATMHTTPLFYHTSFFLKLSQAFYMPATVLSTPTAAAPAVLLQYKDHPNTKLDHSNLCLVSQAA